MMCLKFSLRYSPFVFVGKVKKKFEIFVVVCDAYLAVEESGSNENRRADI